MPLSFQRYLVPWLHLWCAPPTCAIMIQNENQTLTLSHPAPQGLSTSTLPCSPLESSIPLSIRLTSASWLFLTHLNSSPLLLPISASLSGTPAPQEDTQLPSTQNSAHGERMGLFFQKLDQPLRRWGCGGSPCIDNTPYSIPQICPHKAPAKGPPHCLSF